MMPRIKLKCHIEILMSYCLRQTDSNTVLSSKEDKNQIKTQQVSSKKAPKADKWISSRY